MNQGSFVLPFNVKLLLVIFGLSFIFIGLLPSLYVSIYGSDDAGVTKLKKVNKKIKDLDFNSGVFFGNVETCTNNAGCIGTNKDDIIYGGAGGSVFALKGDDMIYGGADSLLYGGDDDDLILGGAGKGLLDGGHGDDVLLAGVGNQLLVGGNGNDKLFGGTGDTVMDGGSGANHFDCPLTLLGLARGVVLDYSPDKGDTVSGSCKIIANAGDARSSNIPDIELPD